ncbi:SDR family oxidoreductase [Congregibacter brevis]|uniref:SDR family oxidoreductase n=1 Tax=Congregibacter brevis TaxID=3081201 RepID=A0ABZ0IA46_9GAMM|nr:SDR family oxidoreductase [Congregibacter sp. IMCC45268]
MSEYLDNLFTLNGKTALVTGGAKGIGRMISEALLQSGARVLISSRSAVDCEAAAAEMSSLGDCRAFPRDLSKVENIAALVADVEAVGFGLDILVNNSGATWGAPIDEFPEAGWDKVMDLNVKSPFFLVQKLLPLLSAGASSADPARIINIGSIAGMMGKPGGAAYSYMASKSAILHLTRGLAFDLASRDITANAIAPGLFPSKMSNHLTGDEEARKMSTAEIPLGRIGTPDDIGGVAVLLCSKAGAYMTGSVVTVSGGLDL